MDISKPTHVIPILVALTDEEWADVRRFFPQGVLYIECSRNTMEDEFELGQDTNFGDFIRWLFKLAPTVNENFSPFIKRIDPDEERSM